MCPCSFSRFEQNRPSDLFHHVPFWIEMIWVISSHICVTTSRSTPTIACHFTFWISLSPLRPKTATKHLNFGLSPELRLTNRRSASSLTSSATRRWFRRISLFIFELAKKNKWFSLIKNWLTYLVHVKSTGELISFGFSDRSVRSLDSAKRSANAIRYDTIECI